MFLLTERKIEGSKQKVQKRNKKTNMVERIKEDLGSLTQTMLNLCKKIFHHASNSIPRFINHNLILYILTGHFWIFRHTRLCGWFEAEILTAILWFTIPIVVSFLFVELFHCLNLLGTISCICSSHGILELLVDTGAVEAIVISLAGALICSCLQIIFLFFEKKGRKFKSISAICKRIMKRYVWTAGTILLCISAFWGIADTYKSILKLQNQKKYIAEVKETKENILENNRFILEKFTEECWNAMDQNGREKACLQLAQLEVLYLTEQLDENLTFYLCKDYSPKAGGYYSNDVNRIVADEQYQMDRGYIIDLVCHESFHYFEYRLMEGAKDIHNLSSKEKVEKYRYEFDHYVDIEDDFDGYYKQLCEVDAREYAARRAEVYLNYIDGK